LRLAPLMVNNAVTHPAEVVVRDDGYAAVMPLLAG
jgi:hypothetical protein